LAQAAGSNAGSNAEGPAFCSLALLRREGGGGHSALRPETATMASEHDEWVRDNDRFSDVTWVGFNQDQTCLVVGTGRGFLIVCANTCALLHREDCGAVSMVEMLFRTSLVALVGDSARGGPSSSGKVLTMWNTKERREICNVGFDAMIHGVRVNHRRVVVFLREEVHIIELRSMKTLRIIDRLPSPSLDPAVGSLCASVDCGYLAMPLAIASNHASSAEFVDVLSHDSAAFPEPNIGLVSVVDTHTLMPVGTVLAHRSPVQALCLNATGQLLASSSVKASVIRLFSVPSFELVSVFRRGTSPCRIFGLSFSYDSNHVCAAASSGTVHIFKNSEQLLAALPLRLHEGTAGASENVPMSCSPLSTNTCAADSLSACMTPPVAEPSIMGVDKLGNVVCKAAADDEEGDFSDWNIVPKRPESALEMPLEHGSGSSHTTKKLMLQALTTASEVVIGSAEKHARSLLQLMPQSCRELVDAERAFAMVRMNEQDGFANSFGDAMPSSSLQATVLGMLPTCQPHGMYVARVNSITRAGSSFNCEVLVASCRGSTHVYEFNSLIGGDARLRTECSFSDLRPHS